MFWSYILYNYNFNGIPYPLTLTIILFNPLISNIKSSEYLIFSLGVNTIGILNKFFYTLSLTPFLFLVYTISNGNTTCPDGILTSK